MNLYQIQSLEESIERLIDEETGEIPEEALKELIEAQTQAVGTLEKVCHLINGLEGFAEMAKTEEARIASQRKIAEKRATQIREYITPYVREHTKVQAGTYTLSIRKSKGVVIDDESKIPAKYFVETITEKLDKTAVKKAVEAGEQIDGARLELRDNLQIK